MYSENPYYYQLNDERSKFDIEHDCEGNTFIRSDLTGVEAMARVLELEADDTVSNIRVVRR